MLVQRTSKVGATPLLRRSGMCCAGCPLQVAAIEPVKSHSLLMRRGTTIILLGSLQMCVLFQKVELCGPELLLLSSADCPLHLLDMVPVNMLG